MNEKNALVQLASSFTADSFGRLHAPSTAEADIRAAILAAALDIVEVKYQRGGGDDSHQLRGADRVMTFCLPWEGDTRREIIAVSD